MESLPEHSFLLSTQISHPLPSMLSEGAAAAAGVEGTPSLLYQSPSSAPDPSLNLCVFFRLGGQLFRLPSTPGPASPVHPLQAGEGFALSRRMLPFHGVSPGTFLFVEHSDLAPHALCAFRGCRPLISGCEGDSFPFISGSVECSRPISKPLRFFQAWRSTFSAPLHTRPGFAGPPSPSRRGLFLCPVGFILLHRSRRARLPGTRCGTADSRPGLKSGGSSSPYFSGTRLFFDHTAVLLPESAGYRPIR